MEKTVSFFIFGSLYLILFQSCKKEDIGSVSGYVRAIDNQTPIEGASVYLRKYTRAHKNADETFPDFNDPDTNRPWVTDSLLTDKNGYYRFETPYPIIVFARKKHYFNELLYSGDITLFENSDNTADLQLEPFAWIRFRAHNVSGAHKLLVYGSDYREYELIVPQNETREMIIPGRNGSNFSYVFLRGPNNEIIFGPNFTNLFMKAECTYRDTSLFEIDF